MQLQMLSNKVFASPPLFSPLGRQPKQAIAVRPSHFPRMRCTQRTVAASASEQTVSRVPASTVDQQVHHFASSFFSLSVVTALHQSASPALLLLSFAVICNCVCVVKRLFYTAHCKTPLTALTGFQAAFLHHEHDELPRAVQCTVDEFQSVSDPKERYKLLLRYAKRLPALDESHKIATNRVMGCTSEVFMTASLDSQRRVQFAGDSNSELTRGLCAVLVQSMSGLTPAEVLKVCATLTATLMLSFMVVKLSSAFHLELGVRPAMTHSQLQLRILPAAA